MGISASAAECRVFSDPGGAIEINDEPEESFQDWIRAKRNSREHVLDEAALQQTNISAVVPKKPIVIDDSIGTFGEMLKNARVSNEGVIDVARASRASRRSLETVESSADGSRASSDRRFTQESRASLSLEKSGFPATFEMSVGLALDWTGGLLSNLSIPEMNSPAGESLVASRLPLRGKARPPPLARGESSSVSNAGTSTVGNSLGEFGSLFSGASVAGDPAKSAKNFAGTSREL